MPRWRERDAGLRFDRHRPGADARHPYPAPAPGLYSAHVPTAPPVPCRPVLLAGPAVPCWPRRPLRPARRPDPRRPRYPPTRITPSTRRPAAAQAALLAADDRAWSAAEVLTWGTAPYETRLRALVGARGVVPAVGCRRSGALGHHDAARRALVGRGGRRDLPGPGLGGEGLLGTRRSARPTSSATCAWWHRIRRSRPT